MRTHPGLTNILLGAALTGLLAACQTAAPLTPTQAPPTVAATALPSATAAATAHPTAAASATAATSAQLVAAAWQAYGGDQFTQAITLAQECIRRWESMAITQQAALTQAPLTGSVSAADKSAILANWALNDVGAAYFILGASLQKQGRTSEAQVAFEKTRLFPYARVWDPQGGFFWAPASAASDSLAQMSPPTQTPPPTPTATPTVTSSPTATRRPTQPPVTATMESVSSAQLIAAAWQAYNANDLSQAINFAQKCADLFEAQALGQQAALSQPPPTGSVSEAEKQAIFANWALNDVGTAYFIIGQARQKQGQAGAAAAAYAKVKLFPYARAWDPRGWFWSPAEAVPN